MRSTLHNNNILYSVQHYVMHNIVVLAIMAAASSGSLAEAEREVVEKVEVEGPRGKGVVVDSLRGNPDVVNDTTPQEGTKEHMDVVEVRAYVASEG